MNRALKLAEISRDLNKLPDKKIDEVKDFVAFMLFRGKTRKKSIAQLEGIWAEKGFERLNLRKELKSVRTELSKSILKRAI